jgi:trehalose 6-phosphate phosphatase
MAAVPLMDLDPLQDVLAAPALSLFSDIDGTLSPIVPRPEDARVSPRCRALLRRLIAEGVQVALITGRTLDVARSMVKIDEAAYAANHGLEFWIDRSTEVVIEGGARSGIIDRILAEGAALAVLGVTVEAKGVGVAFHYRRAADETRARDAIEKLILTVVDGAFERMEGRKVIELRPAVQVNKGTATHILAERLGVNGIICIGDDRTDIDMFRAVSELRASGIEGCQVAVLSAESVPELLASADYTVEGVGGVEWLLGEVLKAVGARSR